MAQKKDQAKQRMRPMLLAFGIIGVAVLAFTLFNRGNLTGNNETNRPVSLNGEEVSSAASGQVQILSESNFDGLVSEGVVLVDFWATWCAPCRIQGPIVEELAREMGEKALISKLDVDDHGRIAALYQVRSIPTLIIFKNGEPVKRFVGVQQKETLAAAINEFL
ncbi:MAG: thioredoxin [Bacteroidales bacterium]